MVAIPTKLRIKFGDEGSVKAFQIFPDVNATPVQESLRGDGVKPSKKPVKILPNLNAIPAEEPIGGDGVKPSKKRGPEALEEEVEELQAIKKQKLDRASSSHCYALIRSLLDHNHGWIFSAPVDPVKLNIPDYFSVISKPMDLGTVRTKLTKRVYRNVDEFAADVRLTFNNAIQYNPSGNRVHMMAKELKAYFEARWDSIEKMKVDCVKRSSSQTSSTTSVELTKPVKEKSLLLKQAKGQSKPKALAPQVKVKKLVHGSEVSAAVKISSKGPVPTAAGKCSSCGSITCICIKSCTNSSRGEALTDRQVTNSSGVETSDSDPHCNELKTTVPAMPTPLTPEQALRAAMLKGQFAETILRARQKKALDQTNKADIIRIQKEKEQMERTQREEKARIEAEMRAAKIAARKRAENELKQRRESERLKLEKMERKSDLEENKILSWEEDMNNFCGSCYLEAMVNLCGCSNLTRSSLHELGLFLKDDDCLEYSDSDVEEGEIL